MKIFRKLIMKWHLSKALNSQYAYEDCNKGLSKCHGFYTYVYGHNTYYSPGLLMCSKCRSNCNYK